MKKSDVFLNKLILLFVFDKIEFPLSENTIIDICCSSNNWISYMDCNPTIHKLIDENFITNIAQYGDPIYQITTDGRCCLADFYTQIPITTRELISNFVKQNRSRYRKKQECTADYYMNEDSTYTVFLKIHDTARPMLELKFCVANRQIAKDIYKKWEEKAVDLYALIYDNLVD